MCENHHSSFSVFLRLLFGLFSHSPTKLYRTLPPTPVLPLSLYLKSDLFTRLRDISYAFRSYLILDCIYDIFVSYSLHPALSLQSIVNWISRLCIHNIHMSMSLCMRMKNRCITNSICIYCIRIIHIALFSTNTVLVDVRLFARIRLK